MIYGILISHFFYVSHFILSFLSSLYSQSHLSSYYLLVFFKLVSASDTFHLLFLIFQIVSFLILTWTIPSLCSESAQTPPSQGSLFPNTLLKISSITSCGLLYFTEKNILYYILCYSCFTIFYIMYLFPFCFIHEKFKPSDGINFDLIASQEQHLKWYLAQIRCSPWTVGLINDYYSFQKSFYV